MAIDLIFSDGTNLRDSGLGFNDWMLNGVSASASYGNVVACQMSYRNSTSGKSQQIHFEPVEVLTEC